MNEQELIAFFQDIHAHPELGFQETRTTERVLRVLRENGIEVLDSGLETGAIAAIGPEGGRVIALRCDMDALPVQEESGLAYASEYPGKMHACGHDMHTTVMLGAALLLKAREKELPGRVKIIFQPAEEVDNGAKRVLATGLLQDVEEFYGIHSYPWFAPGTLGIKEGPVMAAPDGFQIVIRGKGSHAAQPHKGLDPIPAAASLTLAAQHIISRGMDPFAPAVVSITHLEAGTTWNVIPESALLEGTVRTLRPEDRVYIRSALERVALSTAESYGCTAEFTWKEGSPAVINDAALCGFAKEIAQEMGFQVDRQEDTMGGEDFSEYLQQAPGVFIRVGTGGNYANHHPRFTVDPAAIAPAARFFARLAEARLGAK